MKVEEGRKKVHTEGRKEEREEGGYMRENERERGIHRQYTVKEFF